MSGVPHYPRQRIALEIPKADPRPLHWWTTLACDLVTLSIKRMGTREPIGKPAVTVQHGAPALVVATQHHRGGRR